MSSQARTELDAIDLLMQDHREVESLFSEFEYLQREGQDTSFVIASACTELRLHDALENEIFYPAISDAFDEDAVEALLDQAEDAHDDVLDLIEAIDVMDGEAAPREARFSELVERTKQHIAQEEAELFPKAKASAKVDLAALATRMKARIAEFTAKLESAEDNTVSA